MKKYGKYLSSKIVLENYLNESWEVEVSKIRKDSYFRNGWETFVKDNGLKFGDFLWFEYCCDSTFKFKMYGTTCCEKEVERNYEAVDVIKKNEEQVKDDTHGDKRDVIVIDFDDDKSGKF